MTPRRLDWRSRLVAWGLALEGRSFVWGETDCAALARAALAECFGFDVAPQIPRWKTALGAARALRQYPIERTLVELGAQRQTPAFLRAGDIVVCPEPQESVGGRALMVSLDGTTVVGSSAREGVRVGHWLIPPGSWVYSLWEVPAHG